MKKILFLSFLICIIFVSYSKAGESLYTVEYFKEATEDVTNFYQKFKTCSPGKISYKGEKQVIYGKTKDKMCRFSSQHYEGNRLVQYNCKVPMPIAIGITANYNEIHENILYGEESDFSELLKEFLEINNIALDYCTFKEF